MNLSKIPKQLKYIITNLDDDDKPAIKAHLIRLNSKDRYLRFFAAINDFAIEKYVDEIVDFKKSKGYGIYSKDKKTLIAFAHLSESEKLNGVISAEVGMSIDEEHRTKGLAMMLMDRILVVCSSKNISTLFMSCLRENKAMQKIAKKTGMEVVLDHDEAIAKLHLNNDSLKQTINLQKEMVYSNITIFDKMYRQNALMVRALFGEK